MKTPNFGNKHLKVDFKEVLKSLKLCDNNNEKMELDLSFVSDENLTDPEDEDNYVLTVISETDEDNNIGFQYEKKEDMFIDLGLLVKAFNEVSKFDYRDLLKQQATFTE